MLSTTPPRSFNRAGSLRLWGSAPSRHAVTKDWRRALRRWMALSAVVTASFGAGTAQAQGTNSRAELPTVKVGDHWKTEVRDKLTNVVERTDDYVVTASTATQIDLSVGGTDRAVWTSELTPLDNPRLTSDPGYRWLNFPLEVGKSWDFKTQWKRKDGSGAGRSQMDVAVKAYEKVSVRAGEFDAYRVEGKGFMNVEGNWSSSVNVKYWYAPAARGMVRFEWEDKRNRTVSELVEVQLAH